MFVLGTQTASAVDQRVGRRRHEPEAQPEEREVSAHGDLDPVGADAGTYTGSAASATFSLQSK